MKKLALFVILLTSLYTAAQDTFSIVALDSTTRQVGSAGASCVDLYAAGIADNGFLGELFPDSGAINTQASYLAINQSRARARMRAGDTPAQIIAYMQTHDYQNAPSVRQYGVVGFKGTSPSAAGYTGTNCEDYKNHITGNIDGFYYSIQGNILQGQHILDSMEAQFRRVPGDLACKLMAALEGAKVVGADTRCAPNNTSTLFAFLKVMEPTDKFGSPSLFLGVRTHDQDQIEPIDSLAILFKNSGSHCKTSGLNEFGASPTFSLQPNPVVGDLTLSYSGGQGSYSILDISGKIALTGKLHTGIQKIDTSKLQKGSYFIQIGHEKRRFVVL